MICTYVCMYIHTYIHTYATRIFVPTLLPHYVIHLPPVLPFIDLASLPGRRLLLHRHLTSPCLPAAFLRVSHRNCSSPSGPPDVHLTTLRLSRDAPPIRTNFFYSSSAVTSGFGLRCLVSNHYGPLLCCLNTRPAQLPVGAPRPFHPKPHPAV
jgi:hypothetical protein